MKRKHTTAREKILIVRRERSYMIDFDFLHTLLVQANPCTFIRSSTYNLKLFAPREEKWFESINTHPRPNDQQNNNTTKTNTDHVAFES